MLFEALRFCGNALLINSDKAMFPNIITILKNKSSIGMVSMRIPRFSRLLYQTMGSVNPIPVKTPFTIRNGSSNKM